MAHRIRAKGTANFAPHWRSVQRIPFIKNKADVDTTKNIVNKVCYQFCGWIQIFTNVESTIVTAFLNLRCKFLKSCSPPIHAMTMPLIDNDAPILQLQCKFLVFE